VRHLALLLVAQAVALAVEERVPSQAAAVQVSVLAQILILFGSLFILSAALGLIRFPDFYTRLHASTKLVALGGLGIFGGAALAFAPMGANARVLVIASFFFLTAPLSGYMIARAGYLRGLRPYREETSVDDWGLMGGFPEASSEESA